MPTRILFINREGIEQQFLVQDVVVRLGSSHDCELFLDGENEYVAVLRYKDQEYTVVNRSPHPMTVAAKALPPGATLPWKRDQKLVLASGTTLRLVSEGNPAPSRLFTGALDIEQTDEEFHRETGIAASPGSMTAVAANDEIKKKQSRQAQEMGVIGVCLVLIVLMLAGPGGTTTQDEKAVSTEFEKLIRELGKELDRDEDQLWLRFLRDELQTARAIELRMDTEAARSHYQALRDQVDARHFNDSGNPLGKRVYDFALRQLRSS